MCSEVCAFKSEVRFPQMFGTPEIKRHSLQIGFGDSSSPCWMSGLGSLMWGSELPVLWERPLHSNYIPVRGSPPEGIGLDYITSLGFAGGTMVMTLPARDGGAWWLPSMGSHRVGHD